MRNAKTKLWTNLIVGYVLIAAALFLLAGTLRYWQAWVFLCVSAISSALMTISIVRDPILVESRVRAGPKSEQRPLQKTIVRWLAIVGIVALAVPGLDRRFGWSSVPDWLCLAGDAIVLASMWLTYRVFKENSFGSATVEIGKGQHVISSGPYARVRHPMYTGASLYFLGGVVALGSYWALVPAVLMVLGLVRRLFDEEQFLRERLPGYTEYCASVRWRLVPGIF